jgi:hypothetical protein
MGLAVVRWLTIELLLQVVACLLSMGLAVGRWLVVGIF